jgi:hypothetical protein
MMHLCRQVTGVHACSGQTGDLVLRLGARRHRGRCAVSGDRTGWQLTVGITAWMLQAMQRHTHNERMARDGITCHLPTWNCVREDMLMHQGMSCGLKYRSMRSMPLFS